METQLVSANGSGAMFDQIARRYDPLNRLMSFGMDRGWRRKLVNAMPNHGRLLDVATGTADVALDLAKRHADTTVVGLDPSAGMLDVGRVKVARRQLEERIELVLGDAQNMNLPDDHFSGYTNRRVCRRYSHLPSRRRQASRRHAANARRGS